MTNVTHVIVQNNPPPDMGLQIVGRLYPCVEFKTGPVPSYAPNFTADEEEEDEARWEDDGGEVETKVVKPRGRRPAPKVTEADTKDATVE